MAIELSPPSPADSTPPRAPAANAPGKPSSGFSSLLQGLGEPVAQVPTAAGPAVDDATTTGPVGANDVTALAAHSLRTGKALPRGTDSDAATGPASKISASLSDVPDAASVQPSGSVPDSAAQALLAQFLGMAGAHGGSAADTASNADVSRLRQAATAGFSPAAAAAGGATAADANSGLNLLGTQGDPGLGAVPGTGAGKRWLPSGSVQAQAPWKSTVASAGAAQDAAAKLVSARGALSDASAQPLTVLAQTASAPALISALAESDQGLSGRRRGTAPSESTRLDTPNPAGMSGATITPTAGGVATSGASASGQVLEQAVAEQVKYWISNDVHNAQLKFDGLGPQSVQVNISLSGNQAQVVFQSDQAQTRELLSNAMAQLEQMLRGEGLTLTAAWVGSSGQQGQNGSSAQQAQPVPQRAPATTTLSVEAASAPARTAVSTNRAVDLFV